MITLFITSCGELEATAHAIASCLSQRIKDEIRVVVSDPFTETKWMIEEKFPNDKRIIFEEDEGRGKAHALNNLLKKYTAKGKNDILVFTDGDVYLANAALPALLPPFNDQKVGIVCGHPVTLNPRSTMLGYWAHLSLDEFNGTRKALASQQKFFEISGYLFAIRPNLLSSFPTEASEDNVIPTLLWHKGWKIAYAEDAIVHVMCPQTLKDYLAQKKRNIKGHLALRTIALPPAQRKNTFFAEAVRGLRFFFTHPASGKEHLWFLACAFARLYTWLAAIIDVHLRHNPYHDGWRNEEHLTSTAIDESS